MLIQNATEFIFCGIRDEPVARASGSVTNPASSDERKMRSSPIRERWTRRRLAAKRYWDQFDDAPDFVVMYVPGEAFFSAALRADPDLHEFGFSRSVLLTSPANLIAILKSVYYGWQQETVRESAQKIRDLGMELHDRLRVMAEHFEAVGKNLGRAVAAFNDAAGSFEHRVLVAARRFRDLGAAGSEGLPELEPVERAVREIELADGFLQAPVVESYSTGRSIIARLVDRLTPCIE